MKKRLLITVMALSILISTGCSMNSNTGNSTIESKESQIASSTLKENSIATTIENPNYVLFKTVNDIKKDTASINKIAGKYYEKYLTYVAPNGKPIHILAQNQVSDEQMLYAYSVLSFYLESTPSKDKVEVANRLANNKAILVMPNGADRDGKTSDEAMSLGQNLNYSEVANVGGKWYTENDYEHRDASFEEIFHMVHDYGIGTTQNPQADKETTDLIYKGLMNALPKEKAKWGKEGKWALGFGGQIQEWEQEGSLEQEYIVSVIDSYYGLWNAFPEKGGMWGGYIAKSREDVISMDPDGYAVMTSFLSPSITTQMRVDPSFEGTFKMYFDANEKYTFKSQYLDNVTLTGSKDSNLSGNDNDNILMGNQGKNIIDGQGGVDVIQFKGPSIEYEISDNSDSVIITDTIKERDGVDTLKNIEVLRFTDKDIILE